MDTVINERSVSEIEPEDLYRIGWREVCEAFPDGSTQWKRVPLTLEDALHPQMGDVMPESYLHSVIRDYLYDVFCARTACEKTTLVLTDVLVFWGDPELKHHSPDVCVIPNVAESEAERISFHVAKEHTRPSLAVEIVSPDTRVNDVEKKFDHYHRAGIHRYVIIDRPSATSPWELKGYERTPRRYRPMPKDERGRLWLEEVRVFLEIQGDRVVCYDDVTGEAIGDYTAVTNALVSERQRAEVEHERAETERQRAEAEFRHAETERKRAEMEAALRIAEKARADAEATLRTAEKVRADTEVELRIAEKARADAEATLRIAERAARMEAEAKLRALQAELEKLKGTQRIE